MLAIPAAARARACLVPGALALLSLLGTPRDSVAAKTDVVVLRNGDRLTGEVDKLERGKLTSART